MLVTRNVWLKYRSPMDGEGNDLGGGESAASTTPLESEPAADSTDEAVNWEGIADEFVGEDSEGDEAIVEKVEEAAPAVAPTPTPAAASPVETPSVAQPSAIPVPAQSAPEPSAPASPTATPEEYGTWRANRLTQLEQLYAVDEDSATALLTEPETVLPKLAAKVHMEVMENSMRAMQAMVPVMMHQIQQHSERNDRAKNLFHGVNPDLADARYEPMIMELGSSYRRVNQSASPEEAARAIGNLVRAALGIAAPQPQVTPSQGQPVQQRQPAVTPFTPARGAGGVSVPVTPSNPFEAMASEMLNEDW